MVGTRGWVSYVPDRDYVGTDSFSYKATSRAGASHLARVRIVITNSGFANLKPDVVLSAWKLGVQTGKLALNVDNENRFPVRVLEVDASSYLPAASGDGYHLVVLTHDPAPLVIAPEASIKVISQVTGATFRLLLGMKHVSVQTKVSIEAPGGELAATTGSRWLRRVSVSGAPRARPLAASVGLILRGLSAQASPL